MKSTPSLEKWIHLFTKWQNLEQSKIKALEDDKINVAHKLKFVLGRVENILENH